LNPIDSKVFSTFRQSSNIKQKKTDKKCLISSIQQNIFITTKQLSKAKGSN